MALESVIGRWRIWGLDERPVAGGASLGVEPAFPHPERAIEPGVAPSARGEQERRGDLPQLISEARAVPVPPGFDLDPGAIVRVDHEPGVHRASQRPSAL